MYLQEERKLVDSAEVTFTCPVRQRVSQTDAIQFSTFDKFPGLITLKKTVETAVKCPDCGATCRTGTGLETLVNMSVDDVAKQFRVRIGLVEKFMVVAAWLLFVIVFLSLPMLIISWFMVPKAATGWRLAIKVGLVVTSLLSLGFAALMIF